MKFTINTKLNVLIITLIVIFGVLSGSFLVNRESDLITHEMILRANAIARNLAFNSRYALLVGDYEELSRLVSGVKREENIIFVAIKNSSGSTLVKNGNNTESDFMTMTFPITTRKAYKTDDELPNTLDEAKDAIGHVLLEISTQDLKSKQLVLKKAVFWAFLLMIVFYVFAAYWGIGHLISKPLKHLMSGIEKIREGDLDYRIDLGSHDEMSELASSFNLMAQELSHSLVSKDFVDRIIMSMMDALLVVDIDGKINVANRAAYDMLGYNEAELIGKSIESIVGMEILDSVDGYLGDIRDTETTYTNSAGEKVQILFSSATLRDSENEKVTGAVYLALDITDRKSAEKSQDEANRKLRQTAEELQQANEEMRSFAYIVSHDLRAPLVNIKGFSSELKMSLEELSEALEYPLTMLSEDKSNNVNLILKEDVPEALNFIESSVNRMDVMINAILTLSRVGRRELKIEEVDTQSIVYSILDSIKHQLDENNVKISHDKLPKISTDKTAIERIFGNLLDNATKYMATDRDGEIEIRSEIDDDKITFSFRDNGRGIAEEDLDKVFKIFRRAGQQHVKGEGMGLAYVKAIAKRLNGNIRCESEHGVGTTFFVSLPKSIIVE